MKFEIGAFLASLTSAGPAFFCRSRENPEFAGFGDIKTYENCGVDLCDCKVFDLLCLRKNGPELDIFTLESLDYAEAAECPSTECLCNHEAGWDAYQATADAPNFSKTVMADVPSYPELELAATVDR